MSFIPLLAPNSPQRIAFRLRPGCTRRMVALHYGEDRTGQGTIDGIPDRFTIRVVILAWLAAAAAMCWVLMELGILPYDEPPDGD